MCFRLAFPLSYNPVPKGEWQYLERHGPVLRILARCYARFKALDVWTGETARLLNSGQGFTLRALRSLLLLELFAPMIRLCASIRAPFTGRILRLELFGAVLASEFITDVFDVVSHALDYRASG